jgi:drug/metabolite transporter (DMT)-like permease
MRDALGVLLVAVGLAYVVLTRDKLGLVVAFAGVTLLAYGVLRPRLPSPSDGKEPPIF